MDGLLQQRCMLHPCIKLTYVISMHILCVLITKKNTLFSMHYYANCALERPLKIVSEYDKEIPQSQTAEKSMASRGRATQPQRDTRKTN